MSKLSFKSCHSVDAELINVNLVTPNANVTYVLVNSMTSYVEAASAMSGSACVIHESLAKLTPTMSSIYQNTSFIEL